MRWLRLHEMTGSPHSPLVDTVQPQPMADLCLGNHPVSETSLLVEL